MSSIATENDRGPRDQLKPTTLNDKTHSTSAEQQIAQEMLFHIQLAGLSVNENEHKVSSM